MGGFRFLLDRTAVLFLGVAAGVAIGYAFGTGGSRHEAVALAPEAAPIVGAPPAVAPPPPAAAAAPESVSDAPPATVAVLAPAAAPEAPPTPPVVDEAPQHMAESARDGRTIRVGVFGDSFGDGVYSGLYRLLPASAGFQVSKFSQPSTGFTRYRRLNLEEHDDAQIGTDPLDVAVIAFGANDAQGVCDEGHCGKLMSGFWQQVIERRIESYVAMLRRHGAAVYWVGMPVMRDPAFDSDTRAMNAFYAAVMGRLGIPFIDIRPLTADGEGRYEDYYRDDAGTPKLLRAGDGVHMSMNGYIRITRALASRIRATVSAARAAGSSKNDDAEPEQPS